MVVKWEQKQRCIRHLEYIRKRDAGSQSTDKGYDRQIPITKIHLTG
jgi:hypothetical protein